MKNKRKCENDEKDENDDFEELEQTSAYVRWGMDAEQNNAVHTRVTARGIGMVKPSHQASVGSTSAQG